MAILIYRATYNDAAFLSKIASNALSSDATIGAGGGFFSPIVGFDVTSTNAEDTDGTNLDPFMAERGFTRITNEGDKILDETRHWGSFEVADAPDTHAQEGDLGYCTNGDNGLPAPVYYDGTEWKNVYNNIVISVGGTSVATASINSGGSYTGSDGNYPAFQASTSGTGFGASFTVNIVSGAVDSVVSVDGGGSGYAVSDTITLSLIGITENTAAVLDVDSIS